MENSKNITPEMIEEKVEMLVRNEIHSCVSYMVSQVRELAMNANDYDLSEQVMELSVMQPTENDYEEAAAQEDWNTYSEAVEWAKENEKLFTLGRFIIDQDLKDADKDLIYIQIVDDEFVDSTWLINDWGELCKEQDIEPEESEIYEHWVVSDWLARKLSEKGHKVDNDFMGLTIWGRPTTGRSISMDGVMKEIAKDLLEEFE